MSEWKEEYLHKLVDIIVSNVDKKIYPNKSLVKLCNYMDAYSNVYITSNISFSIGSADDYEIQKFGLKKHDVIITKDSETPDDIAVSAVVTEDIKKLVCGYHLAILRPKKNGLDGTYLMLKLRSDELKRYFLSVAKGSTRFGLTIGDIENTKIKFPKLPEQQLIAGILSTADAVIEKTQAAIAKYKAIKQGMLQDLFTRGIDLNTNKLRPRYEDAPELYKECKLGMIPNEWEADCLGSIIEAVDPQPDHRTPHSVENGIPYLGINDMDEYGTIDLPKCRKVSREVLAEHKKRYTIKVGDIMFGKIGTIGEPKKLKNFDNVTLSANVILIQPKQVADYVYWLLRSDLTNEQIKKSIHATSQPAFGMEKIRSLIVPICDPTEQILISQAVNACDNKLKTEQAYLQKMQSLKKGLMEDLLSGKKQVKVKKELLLQNKD